MSNTSQWNVTDGSNTSAPPAGSPEGVAPSTINDTIRAMMGALARTYSDTDGTLTSTGTGTAYVLTTNNAHAALADQSFFIFRAHLTNTGAAATLAVDGLAAKSLRLGGSATLVANMITLDDLIIVAYNSDADAYDILGGVDPNIFTGNITVTGTVDGRDIDTDGTKLDGIEALADVTDTANVTSAGALMDSEVDADLKTFVLPANTTISAFGATVVDDADSDAAQVTLWAGLTAMGATLPIGSDKYLFQDGAVTKTVEINDVAIPVVSDSGTHTFVDGDVGEARKYTGGTSTHGWTMNNGVGKIGQAILVIGDGSTDGPTITAGTATVTSSSGNFVVKKEGLVVMFQDATNIWKISGDLIP